MTILKFVGSFLLLFVGSSMLLAQHGFKTASPESMGMSSERLARMEQAMHQYVDDGQLAGVLTAVMRKGKLVAFDVYGYDDLETRKKLRDNSLFRIYSMTKPIVSVALMMLHEEGKFLLSDPLHKYIPAFKKVMVHSKGVETVPAKKPIRIIDVLRHTTGFGYGWGGGDYVDSMYNKTNRWAMKDNKAFVESLAALPLYHQPGTKWRYGVSTDVAGHLVEVLSGQPLNQFLQERIFVPLKMEDTFFEVPKDKQDRFITHYRPTKAGRLEVVDHPSTSRYTQKVTLFSGGGGLVSSANDYLRFS